ncbi:aflatoxin B1 aldehyde reductase [Entomortierella parvispora]|uniref:Aflatoxin B1 aldehyde reductase n=1 Tax=Entomortierella parvispora TaxID=205924 RepID=A0A9P3HJD3_9FUNG|nr:aflatoxin B1 aldehyde reductase [Entomortierella parvispora]
MSISRTTPRIILGTQSFALETTDPTKSDFRVQGAENFKPFLSCLERYGVRELDTARVYCEGDTETVLGQLLGSPSSPFQPFEISTKVYPVQPGDHGPEALRRHLYRSLEQLKRGKVKIFYLHAPDFFTPFEVTLKAIDELYKEGLFEEFGLSNFASWQIAAVYQICHFKGYVKPTVYQGWYNPLMRQLEREVFPCLKEYDIRFYAYNPIAGGFLTGKYTPDSEVPDGSRFDTKTLLGPYYREQYWSPLYFDAVKDLKAQAAQHNIPLLEASIRWLNHHSGLGPNDGLIFGANDRVQDLEENLQSLQKGPLPSELVKVFEECWAKTKAGYQTYFRRDIREKAPPHNEPEEESVVASSSLREE